MPSIRSRRGGRAGAAARELIMLEVCVEDIRGLRAAVQGGANRVELCASLPQGGITPSAALLAAAVRAPIPVHVLVRPRAGDFVYAEDEAELMGMDVRGAVEAGSAGVVIGASHADGTLDSALLATLIAVARQAGRHRGKPVSLTLHRAFDLCPDPIAALEAAIGLGFDRILTSGGARTALEGRAVLAELVKKSRGRIRILAASGIGPDNVGEILATGVGEIHSSCRAPLANVDPKVTRLEFDEPRPKGTSAKRVAELLSAMSEWHENNRK